MATNEKVADDGGGQPPAAAVTELSYSDAGKELDAIIGEFEAGVIDVDRLVERLERATSIVDELDRRLRRTRMQVEELVPRLEAIGRGEPAAEAGDGEDYDDDELIAEMTMDDRSPPTPTARPVCSDPSSKPSGQSGRTKPARTRAARIKAAPILDVALPADPERLASSRFKYLARRVAGEDVDGVDRGRAPVVGQPFPGEGDVLPPGASSSEPASR